MCNCSGKLAPRSWSKPSSKHERGSETPGGIGYTCMYHLWRSSCCGNDCHDNLFAVISSSRTYMFWTNVCCVGSRNPEVKDVFFFRRHEILKEDDEIFRPRNRSVPFPAVLRPEWHDPTRPICANLPEVLGQKASFHFPKIHQKLQDVPKLQQNKALCSCSGTLSHTPFLKTWTVYSSALPRPIQSPHPAYKHLTPPGCHELTQQNVPGESEMQSRAAETSVVPHLKLFIHFVNKTDALKVSSALLLLPKRAMCILIRRRRRIELETDTFWGKDLILSWKWSWDLVSKRVCLWVWPSSLHFPSSKKTRSFCGQKFCKFFYQVFCGACVFEPQGRWSKLQWPSRLQTRHNICSIALV